MVNSNTEDKRECQLHKIAKQKHLTTELKVTERRSVAAEDALYPFYQPKTYWIFEIQNPIPF